MADARTSLAGHLERVRALEGLTARVAPAAVDATRLMIERTTAAGEAPDGTPWKPTQDRRQPLRNAASSVRVSASGTTVVATVDGHHALHHEGRARGGTRRPIIPTDGIPRPMAAALADAASAEFHRTMGGRS